MRGRKCPTSRFTWSGSRTKTPHTVKPCALQNMLGAEGASGSASPSVSASAILTVSCTPDSARLLVVGIDQGAVGRESAEDVAVGNALVGGEPFVFVTACGAIEVAYDQLCQFGPDLTWCRRCEDPVIAHGTWLEGGRDRVSSVPGQAPRRSGTVGRRVRPPRAASRRALRCNDAGCRSGCARYRPARCWTPGSD